jgi:hypothetical protein
VFLPSLLFSHLRTEAEPASETSYFQFELFYSSDDGKSAKTHYFTTLYTVVRTFLEFTPYMFRQTFVVFRGLIAKVYKNFAKIYVLKISHIGSSKCDIFNI